MPWIALSPITIGIVLWLLVIYEALLGYRKIKFAKAATRMKVHKWVAWVLIIGGPAHGLLATSVFLGWPFRVG
jgi:hypothetical protein